MIKSKFLIVILIIVFVCNMSGFTSISSDTTIEDKSDARIDIQTLLQEYMDDSGTVGACVGFIDNGKVQFFSYGKKSINGEPISENTLFEIGSITKTFTTLALMDMVKSGKMHLDDSIEIYLPDLRLPQKDGKKITLRHLATHYSGLPRRPDNLNPKNSENPYSNYSLDNLYDFFKTFTLQKAPGEKFEYSNLAMGLLGHILSLETGMSYEELIRSSILEKLGMQNTVISLTTEMKQHFSKGHHLGKEVSHWDMPMFEGAGAFRSNIKDMTLFLAANMGMINSSVSDLLKECHERQYSRGPTYSIGLGWHIYHSNEDKIIFHSGLTGGFRSFLGFNPKTKMGIVVLSNDNTVDWVQEFAFRLLDPHYKNPFFIDKALNKNIDYLNKFVGFYEVTILKDLSKKDLEISLFNKQLVCYWPKSFIGEVDALFPEKHGVFGIKWYRNGKFSFNFDDQGRVSKIQKILSSNTIEWEATPKSGQP